MEFIEKLIERNTEFAANGFVAGLKMLPLRRTMIVACVDPRVDPMDIFKLQPGEAAVIRNIGGRVTPALLETMAILRTVTRVAGEEVGVGWNLIVLHHTDCGISGCYHQAPDLLAKHMGVAQEALDGLAITDPYKAVALDVAALKANPKLPGGFMVSGLVYDVSTGKVQTVVAPAMLRADEVQPCTSKARPDVS